jgi:Spy/CpxP family protein refolding chaperone
MRALVIPLMALAVAASAQAPQHGPAGGHTHASPYAGEEHRDVKGLSAEDIAELQAGGGWGMAKAAELNGVPGPAHLLQMRNEIGLSAQQESAIQAIFEDMRARAVAEGARLIALERALDALFRSGGVSEASLRQQLQRIEASRHELRYIHLAAHLTTPALLSEAQLARYRTLRGYADDPCASTPSGHDPARWRQHNGCR